MSIKRVPFRAASGFTLVEMVVAIIIIGIGVAGVLSAYNSSVRGSAEALVSKQLVAIAEEMMEEVLLKPYQNAPGAGAAGSTTCGQPAANRGGFDDVRDYNNYQTTGICGVGGTAVPGLTGYGVSVVVQDATLGTPGVAALRVTVTATHGSDHVVLDGFRTDFGNLP